MGFRFLQAVCAVKTIAPSIPKKRSELREGRPRDPNTLEYTANNPFSVSTITNRGYTFHVRETWLFAKSLSRTIPLCGKHIFEFSLVNMNARMGVYPANSGNPVLRRVISPDNYIQAPDYTQSFNRYSYCWNNPLKYTDPSGDLITVPLLVMAFTADYLSNLIHGHNNPGQSAYNNTMTAYNGMNSATQVTIYSNQNSSLSIGLNPFMMAVSGTYTRNDGGLTSSVTAGVGLFGAYASVGANYRIDYYNSWYSDIGFSLGIDGGGNTRLGGGIEAGNKDFALSLYTTKFNEGERSQQVGGLGIRAGDVRFRYENDGAPLYDWFKGKLNDGGDRYRTAAAQISYKDIDLRMNLYTGDYKTADNIEKNNPNNSSHGYRRKYPHGFYTGGNVDTYRLGGLAIGYKGSFFGVNSENVRHVFQNKIAHHIINPQQAFQVLDRSWHYYPAFYPLSNRYSLW
jgi:RHS repeat-associated protein